MAPDDIERFEAASGQLIDELGYERRTVEVSAEALAHAARVRDAFVDHARSLRETVPAAWEGVAV